MEWYPALTPLGYALAPYPGTHCFVSCFACVSLCVCVCLSVDRSDISFICFELSVDYLSAVRPFCVSWDGLEGGGRSGKMGRKREEQREEGASCYPIR